MVLRTLMGKKVMIISSGQPSLNPRMVKEADALSDAGYDVTVLYAYWNDWGTKFDEALIPAKKWKAVRIGGDPKKDKMTYFLSRMIHKLAKVLGGKNSGELAITRAGYYLIREAPKYRADIYIGHNLGALAATVTASTVHQKPCGFDAEDFHRNEVSDEDGNPDVILKTKLENQYFPQLNYLTASSPLIAAAYQKLFPALKTEVILNVFPSDGHVQSPPENKTGPVRLFWFSQTIGPNRGLVDIINALALLKDQPFELHLLGHILDDSQIGFIKSSAIETYFHEPIPPDEIIAFASQFDIGLALENSTPYNRNICLTNKLFTYLQAGLAIVASDTAAQSRFLAEYPGIGKTYTKGKPEELAANLLDYHRNREKLTDNRLAAFNLGREKLNWETESKSLLALVEKTLNKIE